MVPGGLDWQLCWHGVCPLTARTQQSLRLHLVQFGLPALSNLQGVSLCLSFRNAICTSFPCLQPWLSSSEDEPGKLSPSSDGAGRSSHLLYQAPNNPLERLQRWSEAPGTLSSDSSPGSPPSDRASLFF